MLRISEKLEVGQEYYLVNDKEPLQGTFKIVELCDDKIVFINKFDRRVEVLTNVEDDFRMFYSKSDYLEYDAFTKSTLNKLRYLETYNKNYCTSTTQVRKLLNLMLADTID